MKRGKLIIVLELLIIDNRASWLIDQFFWRSLLLSAYHLMFLAIFCQFYHFSDKCHKIEIVQTRTFANLKKTPSALFQIIKITFWCKNTTFFLYDMMPHLFKVQKLRTYLIRRLKFNNDNKCVFHFFGFFDIQPWSCITF